MPLDEERMKQIQVHENIFNDETRFHNEFAELMGFPKFYGHNWDAWIDCMSCIETPQEQMSKITVTESECLEIEIVITDGSNYFKTETWGVFCSCVAVVNGRFACHGSNTRLIITERSAA